MSVRAVQSLKLSQLRLIAAIDRHRQIIHAAEALGISQPAASRSLAEIERLLDAALSLIHISEPTPRDISGSRMPSSA